MIPPCLRTIWRVYRRWPWMAVADAAIAAGTIGIIAVLVAGFYL